MSFRSNLVSVEQENEELKRTIAELKHQLKTKDKACTEMKRLKGIITAQDEKVTFVCLCVHVQYHFITSQFLKYVW